MATPLSRPFLRKGGIGGFAPQGSPWFAFISGHQIVNPIIFLTYFFQKNKSAKLKNCNFAFLYKYVTICKTHSYVIYEYPSSPKSLDKKDDIFMLQ